MSNSKTTELSAFGALRQEIEDCLLPNACMDADSLTVCIDNLIVHRVQEGIDAISQALSQRSNPNA